MAGRSVKGHVHRTIQTPGYRVHSKYDLKGLRERIVNAKASGSLNVNLPLTPMIDMMSILIIFLLMNFSATGEVFFVNKDSLTIPDAAHARPLENAALISITKDRVYFDAVKVGDTEVSVEETDLELPQLRARLQQMRLMEQQIRPGENFKGMVNIQADQEAPIVNIKRVMNVLISEGWTGINFAVNPTSERKPAQE